MFPKFGEGEWVILVDHILSRFGGYVVSYDYRDNTYFVELSTKSNGESTYGHLWVHESQLIHDEIALDETEIKQLMDLALDTNDKAWFMELSQQLEGVTI